MKRVKLNLEELEKLCQESLNKLYLPLAPSYEDERYYELDIVEYVFYYGLVFEDNEFKVILKYFPDFIFFNSTKTFSHDLQDYALQFIKDEKHKVMPGFSMYDTLRSLIYISNPSENIIMFYLSEYFDQMPECFKKNLTLKHFEKAFRNQDIKEILE